MKCFIGFGKFSKFYWLIICSSLIKLLINILLNLKYLNRENIFAVSNSSLLKSPVLNKHIFIYFIYYYFGLFAINLFFLWHKYAREKVKKNYEKYEKIKEIDNNTSLLHQFSLSSDNSFSLNISNTSYKSNKSNKISFIFPNTENYNYKKEYKISKRTIKLLILISFFYIISEFVIYFVSTININNICFGILEIFFIHFLLLKQEKMNIYQHHILSYIIIIIFGFLMKLISSSFPQCVYPEIDPEEEYQKMKKNSIFQIPKSIFDKIIKPNILKTNERGRKICENSFNIYLYLNGEYYKYFYILIIAFVAIYLITLFLHSYSIVKIRQLINKKYISPYSILFFIGFVGLTSNIVALIISTNVPCGHNNFSLKICEYYYVVKDNNNGFNSMMTNFTNFNFTNRTFPYNGNYSFDFNITFNMTNNTISFPYKYYFDSFFAYLSDLKNIIKPKKSFNYMMDNKKPIQGYSEIFASIILLPILSFFKANFDFYIIKELSLFHLLLTDVIYQLIKDVIIIFIKINKHINDKVQNMQFIVITIGNIATIIGLCIYLELIELKCCGLNKNTRKNISVRSLSEVEGLEEISDNEIFFGDNVYGVNERDSINEYTKDKNSIK